MCYCVIIPILLQVRRPSVVAKEGDVAELRVRVSGSPKPDVYWRDRRDRDIDTTKGRFKLLDDGSLQVSDCNRN